MADTTKVQDMISYVNSDGGKLVLLYLSRVREAAAEDIATALDITLVKTYSIMRTLKNENIIEQVDTDTYKLAV